MFIVELILVLYNIFGTTLLLPPSFFNPYSLVGNVRARSTAAAREQKGRAGNGGGWGEGGPEWWMREHFPRQQLQFLETEETLLGVIPITPLCRCNAGNTSSKPVLDQTGGRGVWAPQGGAVLRPRGHGGWRLRLSQSKLSWKEKPRVARVQPVKSRLHLTEKKKAVGSCDTISASWLYHTLMFCFLALAQS